MKKLFILLLFISFNSFGQAVTQQKKQVVVQSNTVNEREYAEKEPKEMKITRPDTINIKEMSVIVIPKVSHTPLGGDGIIKRTNKKKIEMTPFEFIIDKWKPKKKLFLRLKKLILAEPRH
jgi:hypothetical protein